MKWNEIKSGNTPRAKQMCLIFSGNPNYANAYRIAYYKHAESEWDLQNGGTARIKDYPYWLYMDEVKMAIDVAPERYTVFIEQIIIRQTTDEKVKFYGHCVEDISKTFSFVTKDPEDAKEILKQVTEDPGAPVTFTICGEAPLCYGYDVKLVSNVLHNRQ